MAKSNYQRDLSINPGYCRFIPTGCTVDVGAWLEEINTRLDALEAGTSGESVNRPHLIPQIPITPSPIPLSQVQEKRKPGRPPLPSA